MKKAEIVENAIEVMPLGNSKQKGITLIALVITIIVILILAGVTISMVFRKWWNNSKCWTCKWRICKTIRYWSNKISSSSSRFSNRNRRNRNKWRGELSKRRIRKDIWNHRNIKSRRRRKKIYCNYR